MSLLKKTFLVLTVVGFIIFLSLYQLLYVFLMGSYTRLEEQSVATNIDRARNALQEEVDSLQSSTNDWATFDDTFFYMQNHDPGYVEANLPPSILETLNLYAILYIDNSNQIVQARTAGANPLAPPNDLRQYLDGNHALLNAAQSQDTSGLIVVPEGPMIISACPILTSDGTGPPQGILIMARRLDQTMVNRLNSLTNLSFRFLDASTTSAFSQPVDEISYQRVTTDIISGSTLITNWENQPALVLKLTMPRTIYQQGLLTIGYFARAIGVIVLIFCLLVWLLFRKLVIHPIEELGWSVNLVGQQGDFKGRVPVSSRDEVGALGLEINYMLGDLEQAHRMVAEGKAQYQELFEGALSANYISAPDGKLLLCNHVFMQIMGYGSMEEALATNTSVLYEDSAARQRFLDTVRMNRKLENIESRLRTRDGKELTFLENVVGVFNDQDELIQIRGFMVDITSRKEAEEAILYLSFHDQLTGLYNRSYLEQKMAEMDVPVNLPLSVIVVDVNGLKLVNDAMGHFYGDMLLKGIAQSITSSCRQDDVICRWGGDEYLVLMPRTPSSVATVICQRMKSTCDQIIIQGIKTSASIGVMTKDDPDQLLSDILKEAEERMYREKLLERTSNRHSIIRSLEKSLQEKTPESDEHIRHLQEHMVLLGQCLGLPESELYELRLLATLHDIGKVAIPENILHKATALTFEEHEILKKHSEIGYRIAKSIPEMDRVAEAILCHHERWDGKGYPLGLAGDEIPLHARILSIANFYDVFFYGRQYQERMSNPEVIIEFSRRAGTHFDPQLAEAFVSCLQRQPAQI